MLLYRQPLDWSAITHGSANPLVYPTSESKSQCTEWTVILQIVISAHVLILLLLKLILLDSMQESFPTHIYQCLGAGSQEYVYLAPELIHS